jgi:ATP-dependent Zn protease
VTEITAYHEAGHAFVAHYVGARVRSVTIEPDWDDGPLRHADVQIEWPRGRFSEREFAERSVLVALAGPVTEMIHRGEPYHPGFVAEWAADWQLAWEAAARLVPRERKRLAFLEQSTVELYRVLDHATHWAAVAALVDELLAHETLDAEMVEASLANWPI